MADVMGATPVNAWVMEPVGRAIQFVADEAKICGLLQRSLTHIELGRPLFELAAQYLASSERREPLDRIEQLLREAPVQEQWAADLRANDYAVLNSHSLVAVWGALESCVEDTVVAVLRRHPEVRARLAVSGLRVKASKFEDIAEEGLRRLYRALENAVRVEHDVVTTQERLLRLLDIGVELPNERASLQLTNALRNCLVHRGGVIDEKSVQQAPDLRNLLGNRARITRELYLRCHQAVSELLIRLARAIMHSPYYAERRFDR